MVRIVLPEPGVKSWDACVNAGTAKTSQISGIRCDFLVGAVCCQVKMLNNGIKIRRLNGASTLIFLPGSMEESQLAISGILMKTSILLKTNGNWDRL